MNRPLRTLLIVAVVAAGFSVSHTATAQYGFGYSAFAGPNFYVDQRPPYFAQFPPVYYKHPIQARQYGDSPFAYPACGCGRSTTVEKIEPAMIRNPFVKPSKGKATELKEASTATKASVGPLLIRNPYVDAESNSASKGAANRGVRSAGLRSAQTVYPSATFVSRR